MSHTLIEQDEISIRRLLLEIKDKMMATGAYRRGIDAVDKSLAKLVEIWVRGVRADMVDLLGENYSTGYRFRPIHKGFSTTANSTGPRNTDRDDSMSLFAMVDNRTKTSNISYIRRSPYNSNMEEDLRAVFQGAANVASGEFTSRPAQSFADLDSFIKKSVAGMTHMFNRVFDHAVRSSKMGKNTKTVLRDISKQILLDWAAAEMQKTHRHFLSALDQEIKLFVDEIAGFNQTKLPSMDHDLYNFLLQAEDTTIRKFRQGALRVMAHTGIFYRDDKVFWEKIDRGAPIHSALAEKFGVSASTIKNVWKKPQLILNQTDIPKLSLLLANLDILPQDFWPKTKEDILFFKKAVRLAEQLKIYFGGNKISYLMDCAKDLKNHPQRSWEAVVEKRLRHEIREILSKSKSNRRRTDSAAHAQRKIEVMYTTLPQSTFEKALNEHLKVISTIIDMKRDMRQRLLLPWAMLHVEAHGYKTVNTDALSSPVESMYEALWENVSPGEQVAANSYWHSSRVNISSRFQSAALTTSAEGLGWISLFEKPLKLDCGAALVPLDSNDKLKEEAAMLGHCVWSYGVNCLKYNYHIFSVRDGDKRQSTLTVIDYFEDGVRKLKLSQHTGNGPGSGNARINSLSKQAEIELLKKVNAGTITPDWLAIDKSKEVFLGKEADFTVGYDFRDAAKLQAVFDVYEPCLPRKLLKRLGRDAPGFLEGLEGSNGQSPGMLVAEFLASARNVSQGGIVRQDAAVGREQFFPAIGA